MIIDISDTKTEGNLGCSDHTLVAFVVLMGIDEAKGKVGILNFRKAKFQLVKELVNRTPQSYFCYSLETPCFPPGNCPQGQLVEL